jgi:thioredoxin
MAAVHITTDNFETEVLQSDKPVLLDFWASWCGPCQQLSPIIEELAEEVTDVKIGKVNIDEEMELAKKFRVMSIPTLVVIDKGEKVNVAIGAKTKEEIQNMLIIK